MPSTDDATRKLRSGSREPLLRVEALSVQFALRRGLLRRAVGQLSALVDVDLRVLRGQTLAVVGEAGSGKTTLSRAICHAVPATAGKVLLEGKDLLALAEPELKKALRRVQVVSPQKFSTPDPLPALRTLFELEPALIIFDEPFALLDAAVQRGLFEQLRRLQGEHALTCLFLTRSLEAACALSDEVAVLHAGQLVETGAAASLVSRPSHPYTQGLVGSSSGVGPSDAPRRAGAERGCSFRGRCAQALVRCAEEAPPLFAVPGGLCRCFLYDPDVVGADSGASRTL